MKIKYIANAFIPLVLTLIILLLQGCGSRKDILNIALTQKDKIPQILLYDPEDGNLNVPLNTRISVVFSKSMDRESVESNFSYSYNDKTYGKNSGYFDWNDDNTGFIFTPSEDFPAYTDVFVTITNDAKSSENINLTNDLTWSFTTSDSDDLTQPHVSSVTPFDGTLVETDQYISISITFNEAMLKGTVENSFYIQSDDGNDIRDNNSGYFMWNGNEVTYYPNEPLNENNLYYIYLDKNGNIPWDLAGNALISYTAVSFYTNSDEIFVSLSGDDTSNYGTNRYSPFKTIGQAINFAKGSTKYHVINIDYSNNYNESIYLDSSEYNGLTIRGGWNTDFTQQDGTTTIIYDGNYVVDLDGVDEITLENLSLENNTYSISDNEVITISNSTNVKLNSLNIIGSSNSSGSNIYGIYIASNSLVSISNCSIDGGGGSSSGNTMCMYVDNSTITIDNCTINGGSNSGNNYGIYLTGSSNNTVVKNSNIVGGGSGAIYGVYIDGCSPTIENNQSISAGSTSGNPSYGIYITNSASPVIRDNHFIDGGDINGSDSSNNTYGIYVDGCNSVNIYRNIVVGGSESEGGSGDFNCAIYYKSASSGNLFNNFIVGGKDNTDSGNKCYGVYLNDSTVKILNNTINSGGQAGTAGPSYSIYGICSASWNINPIMINNLIIGGEQNTTYGIYLDTNESPISVVIFNNIFNDAKCTHLVSTSGVDINNIATLEGTIGNSSFDPDPKNNIDYTNDADVTFIDKSTYDYHINTDLSDQLTLNNISSNGFNVDSSIDATYNNDTIYAPQDAALYDIDDEPRPSDYSKIDLGADEFAP